MEKLQIKRARCRCTTTENIREQVCFMAYPTAQISNGCAACLITYYSWEKALRAPLFTAHFNNAATLAASQMPPV